MSFISFTNFKEL